MPKSAEAKARAAKALKDKRHRIKAEQEAKAQLDATANVACEDCRKHIAANVQSIRYVRELKAHIKTLDEVIERRDDTVAEQQGKMDEFCRQNVDLAKKLDEANHKLKLQRLDYEKEILELKIEHAEKIRENELELVAMHIALERLKTKPAEEQNIFIDPKDSPSRSPAKKKKKKKKGGWGGDRKSAAAKKQQADKKQQCA